MATSSLACLLLILLLFIFLATLTASAGEDPIAGADGKALCQGIRQRASLIPMFAEDPDDALGILADVVEAGDVVLVQGAGNVNRISSVLTGVSDG